MRSDVVYYTLHLMPFVNIPYSEDARRAIQLMENRFVPGVVFSIPKLHSVSGVQKVSVQMPDKKVYNTMHAPSLPISYVKHRYL